MPVLTGIEAAQKLRDGGSTAKFVFLTVHDEPNFLRACFAEGGFGYVKKSRVATDLMPAIDCALSRQAFHFPAACALMPH